MHSNLQMSQDRNVPDVKKAQESWQRAKREHAMNSEKQAREQAMREARAEAERLIKLEAKAAAQLEALKQVRSMQT
jgi:hypothetical protein